MPAQFGSAGEPGGEASEGTLLAFKTANHDDLAAILAKLIAAPAGSSSS